ncbi:response regulator transcription factor [Simiduia aestuariiviva]|uniref:DNA-binding response OmpR family regulator n=1 Tax=Simiduia aestuariiviva TaxID=1510459 RepID=A0A839UJ37_9GAMM|nr:response regulator [Simiduia aestuariiviva]MBB3167872.1 DNA-binding response OmpR family regulator [Simiduia aestuariiviva]
MAHIFWVEDQSHWVEKFSAALSSGDFDGQDNQLEVFHLTDSAKQYIAQASRAPDIAILDANMNGNDSAGFAVAQALQKKWPDLPIIYLSEHSGTDIEASAFERTQPHDFIAKHQRNVEQVLCWRIKAILRQRQLTHAAAAQTLSRGELTIDLQTWDVYWRGVKLMNPNNPKRALAPTPRKILKHLVEVSPRAVGTLAMAEALDADPEKFSSANYRQHIRTLRSAFDYAEGGASSFTARCKTGSGIITAGDQGAYAWSTPK